VRYAVAIETEDARHAWGVTVPDPPGCFSAGDAMEEALDNAREAILLHLEGLLDDEQPVPTPQPIDHYRNKREFKNRVWALVDVDLSQLEDVTERINITLPRRVLSKLDAAARGLSDLVAQCNSRPALLPAVNDAALDCLHAERRKVGVRFIIERRQPSPIGRVSFGYHDRHSLASAG
jgi:predicted RNase H-like HicB family nuclease